MTSTNNNELIIESSIIIDKYKELLLCSSSYQEDALENCRHIVKLSVVGDKYISNLPIQLLTSRDRILQYYGGFALPFIKKQNWYGEIKQWLKHEDDLLTFIALDNLIVETKYPSMRRKIVNDPNSLAQIISLIDDSNRSRVRELAANC